MMKIQPLITLNLNWNLSPEEMSTTLHSDTHIEGFGIPLVLSHDLRSPFLPKEFLLFVLRFEGPIILTTPRQFLMIIDQFLSRHLEKDKNEFEFTLNRLFMDLRDEKPKNWKYIKTYYPISIHGAGGIMDCRNCGETFTKKKSKAGYAYHCEDCSEEMSTTLHSDTHIEGLQRRDDREVSGIQ